MMFENYEIVLTAKGASPLRYIPMLGVDAISIETQMLMGGTTFNSGVIEIKKANCNNGSTFSFGTPQTISAPGLTEIDSTNLIKAAWLVLEVTTAASAATVVRVKVHATQLGFKLD